MTDRPNRQRATSAGLSMLLVVLFAWMSVAASPQGLSYRWYGYGHDPQHTAISANAIQPLNSVHWSSPVDLSPQYVGGDLFIHYGTPLITTNSTLILPVKILDTGSFKFEGRSAVNGALKWTINTDYVLPSHNWVPSISGCIAPNGRFYFPGQGGTIYYVDNPDANGATVTGQIAFYGLAEYQAHKATYDANVIIDTPITVDRYGDIFFGFVVLGANNANLVSGLARIGYNGVGSWVSATSTTADESIKKVAYNCAPGLSNDHRTIYFAVNSTNGSGFTGGYLVALDNFTLANKYKVRLKDVINTSNDAVVSDDGTASPTIGPNGDVFYGVLENPFPYNHARGWMLHFDSTLTTAKTPGAFGWDDTASIVPKSMVPSYTGASSYLILTKYNNYLEGGGDGKNKMAVLDPSATMTDPISGATVMKEIFTVLGPTPDPRGGGSVYEWCINTAAVDPQTKSILINSEDGSLYRWDMVTGTITQGINLTAATGEAYTPTIIGLDGTVFCINNATLWAIGR